MSDTNKNMPGEIVIDLSYLNEIAGGSSEFMIEMIDMFLEQTPGYMDQIQNAIPLNNWEEVAQIAHKVKPTFAFVGLEWAKNSLAFIELNAKKQENLQQLAEEFGRLNALRNEIFEKLIAAKESLPLED